MSYVHPIAFIRTRLDSFIDRDEKAEKRKMTSDLFMEKLKGYYDELVAYPCQPMTKISFADFEDAAKRTQLRVEAIVKMYEQRQRRAQGGGLF